MSQFLKSKKLDNVCYDIRGPVLEHAKRMEEEGHRIIKLNIGNPAAFGFEAPDEITQDVVRNISKSSGYTESFGLFGLIFNLRRINSSTFCLFKRSGIE